MKDYTGVRWMPEFNKWQSTLRHNGVYYNLGLHVEQIAAVKARDICIINNGLKVALQVIKPIKNKK